jgi:hypothetical protein
MATKPDTDHIELSEPAFLKLERELSAWSLLRKHQRALLICEIPCQYYDCDLHMSLL